MGSLYCQPVLVQAAILRREPKVLDIGTGTGIWAVQMAQRFPDAEIVGLDITDVELARHAPLYQSHRRHTNVPVSSVPPDNCRFEVDDVNHGLPHYRASFDVIHVRGVGDGIKDYSTFLDEMYRTLRPGGILLVVEWDFRIRNEHGLPISVGSEAETVC